MYRGVILGNVAAFKEHCSLGLWGEEMARTLREAGIDSSEGMGTFGKLTSVEDLPPAAQLEAYIRQAAELIGGGTRTKSIQRVAKPVRKEVSLPVELSIAFQTNRVAAEAFARLSPSCRREYAEWIDGAKRSETRLKRTATAVLWISKGRSLNARYETAGVRSSAPEGQQVSQAR